MNDWKNYFIVYLYIMHKRVIPVSIKLCDESDQAILMFVAHPCVYPTNCLEL